MMLKKLFGLTPKAAANGAFSPSPLALKLTVAAKTPYRNIHYAPRYQGRKKVLMVCTQERYMTMQNGRRFATGNHPVEMFVPMLHLRNAGFDVDIATPTGLPVRIEQWAMPRKDRDVAAVYDQYGVQFEHPLSLHDFVANQMRVSQDYIAVFLPGGHGAMLGLPDNQDLQCLLHWAHQQGIFVLAICHGPAVLLAADRSGRREDFLYNGYRIAAFSDAVDAQTPKIGYMPGGMPWYMGEKLAQLGVSLVNGRADATCHRDRKLLTAASPKAADAFGQMVVRTLLEAVPQADLK